MRVAVIADVHANLAALEAVLAQLRIEAPDRVVCLGDTVGYNAQPRETLALVRERCDIVVEGNHDHDSLGEAQPTTNAAARAALEYTRSVLGEEEQRYLRGLPNIHREPELVAVHGCFLNDRHITGYVTSTMLERNLARVQDRPDWGPLALCGHTHVPMIGYHGAKGVEERRAEGWVEWPADARTVLINPGSVGQPRDHRPESSYCVIDTHERSVQFRRVAYDVARTVAENQRAGLPPELSQRLQEGR